MTESGCLSLSLALSYMFSFVTRRHYTGTHRLLGLLTLLLLRGGGLLTAELRRHDNNHNLGPPWLPEGVQALTTKMLGQKNA